MEIDTILQHKEYPEALKRHEIGLKAFFAGEVKTQKHNLDISFDKQCQISSDLKIPLYDIMMFIRSKTVSSFVSKLN